MARLFVCDTIGRITADIEAAGPTLRAALDHEQADSVIRCAVLMGLSALAEGGEWPAALLEFMTAFMSNMKDGVYSERLA